MNGLFADIRYAFRIYLMAPVAYAFTLLALALSLAFVGAFLALWNDLSLKPHPGFEDGGQLLSIGQSKGERVLPVSLDFIEDLNAQHGVFAAVAGVLPIFQDVRIYGVHEPFMTELVSTGYFSGLRPEIHLGRGLDRQDHHPDAEPAVVISHQLWQSHFGGNPGALGEALYVLGPDHGDDQLGPGLDPRARHRIVGVMSPRARGTFGTDTALWLPVESGLTSLFSLSEGSAVGRIGVLYAVARLARDMRMEAATALLAGRYTGEMAEALELREDYRLGAVPGLVPHIGLQQDVLRHVRLFLAGALLVTLVVASNVTLFLMSRAPARQRELSIRMSVGASRRRLVRQLMTESALLTVLATLLGLLISLWLAALLRDVSFLQQAHWRNVAVYDWRVLAGLGGVVMILTALVALTPLLSLRATSLSSGSRRVSARAGWGQWLAGTVQFAIAGMLGGAALAVIWHLLALLQLDTGFEPDDIVVLQIDPPADYAAGFASPDQLQALRRQRRELLTALPAVDQVAFGRPVPGQHPLFAIPLPARAADRRPVLGLLTSADPAYGPVLGLRLARGRYPEAGETGAILVNETLAQDYWGHLDILGERLSHPPYLGDGQRDVEVVGVVRDVRFTHPAERPAGMIFAAALPTGVQDATLVRTTLQPEALRAALLEIGEREGMNLIIREAEHLSDLWAGRLMADRTRTGLTAVAAILVIVLSALGFYGTQHYLVAAGRREYAIHAAVGAGPSAVSRLVMRRGLRTGLAGLILGSVLALIMVAWMRDDLVSATVAPITVALLVAAGLLLLIAVSVIAPGRRVRRMALARLLRDD